METMATMTTAVGGSWEWGRNCLLRLKVYLAATDLATQTKAAHLWMGSPQKCR